MLKTSKEFQENIKAQNREITGYVKVNYEDGQWYYTIIPIIEKETEELMCDDFCVCGEVGRAINYASLERDFFKLDGSFVLPSNPNVNKYKWLKITKDRSFIIPFDTENDSIGISVALELSIDSYNTNLIKINGKNGGQAKVYVNNDGCIEIDGTWNNQNIIKNPLDLSSRMIEKMKNYKVFYFQSAPEKNNSYVNFEISIIDVGTFIIGTVGFTTDIEEVESVEFSQDNDSIEKISSIKIPKITGMYGYLDEGLNAKFMKQQYLGDLKYYYEFSNESLNVKDLINQHIAIISSLPELENKICHNEKTGFISNTLNTTTITVDVKGNLFLDSKNFTLYFLNGYPLSFDFMIYYKDRVGSKAEHIYTKEINNASSEIIHVDFSDMPDSYITKIVISVKEWSNPNHRVRLEKIDVGYTEIYEKDLVSFNILEEISKFNESSPNYSCEICINNYDRKFDFINDQGLFQKLNKHVTVEPYIGLKSNLLEYVPLGYFNFSNLTNSSDLKTTMQFEGNKMLSKTLSSIQYSSNLGFISTLIKKNDFVNWEIANESLGVHVGYDFETTSEYDNSKTSDEVLQNLCFASCSLCLQSRYAPILGFGWGISYIKKLPSKVSDQITLNEQTEYPTVSRKSKINQVISKVNNIFNLSSEEKEIFNQTIEKTSVGSMGTPETSHKTYNFDFEFTTTSAVDYLNMKIYVDNNLIDSQSPYFFLTESGNYFNHKISITASGLDENGKFDENNLKNEIAVRIMAKTYESQDVSITFNKNDSINEKTGIEFNNNYLRNVENQQHVANYIFENDYPYHASLKTICNPLLLPGDLIDFETPFGFKRMMIEKQTITYNGGLSALIEGDAYDIEDV